MLRRCISTTAANPNSLFFLWRRITSLIRFYSLLFFFFFKTLQAHDQPLRKEKEKQKDFIQKKKARGSKSISFSQRGGVYVPFSPSSPRRFLSRPPWPPDPLPPPRRPHSFVETRRRTAHRHWPSASRSKGSPPATGFSVADAAE